MYFHPFSMPCMVSDGICSQFDESTVDINKEPEASM
jgi:hypothetical protein